MNCAVIGCSNQSSDVIGCNDTTFHAVPTNRKLREKWLSILDTAQTDGAIYVCSLHFNYDDFSPSGKLRPGAVPELLMACRICLAVGGKMYDMSSRGLNKAYEELTGLVMWDSDGIPNKLCWECAHRLLSSRQLREKALLSHNLLTEVTKYKFLTTDAILNIDRIENNLISRLTHKNTIVDEYDLLLHEDEDKESADKKIDIDICFKDDTDIDIPLKEELFFSDNDDRGVSPELFTEENVIEPETDVEFEKPLLEIAKNNRPLREKNKLKKKIKTKKAEKPKHDKRSERKITLDESIFEITHLSMEEQREDIQKRKQGSTFKNAKFKCLVCYKGFGEESSYTMHMYRHSDKSGLYECDICKIRFKIRRDVNQHMRSHMQKFTCKSCPYVTTRICAAKSHENYHNGKVYFCPHCSEQFDKVSTYMSHVRIKHPSDFVCELCGYSFVSEKGVVMHKRLKHRLHDDTIPPDGPLCQPCDIRFQNEAALQKHLLLSPKHNIIKSPIRPPRGPNRQPQKDQGIVKGPICCEQCDEKLPNAVKYFQHFRRAHPDKNRTNFPSTKRMRSQSMCEVCGKMFQSLALLIDHSHTHTSEKQFSCTECNKKFQRRYRLVQHLKLHQQASRKTHVCPQCGKRLSSKSNLYRHAFTHTNVKPYKCEMCDKNFKHTSQRREHIAYVHMKKPWPKRNKGDRRTVMPQDERDDDQMWACE